MLRRAVLGAILAALLQRARAGRTRLAELSARSCESAKVELQPCVRSCQRKQSERARLELGSRFIFLP